MEVRDRRDGSRGGDARVLSVHRRRVEGASERSTLVTANRRTIQPIDSIQWPAGRAQRPFAFRAVGDREGRDLAGGIVSRDNGITAALPAIVSLGIRRRPAHTHRRPPTGRIDRDRIELDEVADRSRPSTRDPEHDGRTPVGGAQTEASWIELESGDGVSRTPLSPVQGRPFAQNGIPCCLVGPAPFGAHASSVRQTCDISQPRFLARAQIEHAAAGRVPRTRALDIDIDVIFI